MTHEETTSFKSPLLNLSSSKKNYFLVKVTLKNKNKKLYLHFWLGLELTLSEFSFSGIYGNRWQIDHILVCLCSINSHGGNKREKLFIHWEQRVSWFPWLSFLGIILTLALKTHLISAQSVLKKCSFWQKNLHQGRSEKEINCTILNWSIQFWQGSCYELLFLYFWLHAYSNPIINIKT